MKFIKENKIIICVITIIIIIVSIYIINKRKQSKITYDNLDITTEWNENEARKIELENNKNIEITSGGTYIIEGTSTNSNILVNTEGDVILVLNNAEITNKTGPAITIENANKTVITLNENTTNKLSNGDNENEDYDAVIYSKDDLTINGEGTLEIISNFENGIKCTDDLKIMSGNITINSKTNGIIGKDSLTIKSGNIEITSGKDAIKSNNDEETEKGNIIIEDANIIINSEEDGIQAENNLTINNGTFKINSNDDGIHATGLLEINNGTINIIASEGLEATYVKINDGNITIEASDDGINAGKKSNNYTPTIEINGGILTIKMGQGDTDAIDSNGNLYINGGTLNITAQSPFDYDMEAKYTGGKMIVNGTETTEITNQFGGMMKGEMNNRQNMPNENGMQPKQDMQGRR